MKKRIIPSILLNNGSNICLSKEFSPWRTIGALTQVLRLHVQRGADELLVINLDSAGIFDRLPSQRIFSIIRNEVDIPIAYAGGIASVETATACINSGFDKVYVTSALDKPEVVHQISNVIGVQSLGICLPFRKRGDEYFVWDYRTSTSANLNLSDAIHLAIGAGSGEILLYDIDADGSLRGLILLYIVIFHLINSLFLFYWQVVLVRMCIFHQLYHSLIYKGLLQDLYLH